MIFKSKRNTNDLTFETLTLPFTFGRFQPQQRQQRRTHVDPFGEPAKPNWYENLQRFLKFDERA